MRLYHVLKKATGQPITWANHMSKQAILSEDRLSKDEIMKAMGYHNSDLPDINYDWYAPATFSLTLEKMYKMEELIFVSIDLDTNVVYTW